MNNIKRIIREEIYRYLLKEDISSLSTYSNELTESLNRMKTIDYSALKDDVLKKYIRDYQIYIIQIINAINRCVGRNNLTEGASLKRLSTYGIELPQEFGGNIGSDFWSGYHTTKNFLMRRGYRNGYSSIGSNVNGINPTTVKSVNLYMLLNRLPRYQSAYLTANTKYNIDGITREPRYTLYVTLPNLRNEYNGLVSAATATTTPTGGTTTPRTTPTATTPTATTTATTSTTASTTGGTTPRHRTTRGGTTLRGGIPPRGTTTKPRIKKGKKRRKGKRRRR